MRLYKLFIKLKTTIYNEIFYLFSEFYTMTVSLKNQKSLKSMVKFGIQHLLLFIWCKISTEKYTMFKKCFLICT